MRGLFILSLLLLCIYEFTATWLVMPLPGSQELDSVQAAWFLHHYRWWIRLLIAVPLLYTFRGAFIGRRKWLPGVFVLITCAIVYASNFILSAEALFQPPSTVRFASSDSCGIPEDAIVTGIVRGNEAKAYPIRYTAYHHQVYDTIDSLPVLVTYCSVCRSGRAYEATLNGNTEGHRRLVGMTHHNAMFEDAATGSWWMQATGEAVAGPMKGQRMKEFPSVQMSLRQWLQLHPNSKIMLPDPASIAHYDPEAKFEHGRSTGSLTRRDTASWKEKSWVVGVISNHRARAYDWNDLESAHVINDTLGGVPIAVVLAGDRISFTAFRRPGPFLISVTGDTIRYGEQSFDLTGRPVDGSAIPLERIPAYQEHWHSWKEFHGDERFNRKKP
jgi:hypothetical protein